MANDLHTHSSASDGTEAPAVVVQRAAEAGLRTLALTDHDTTLGWAEAADAALLHGIRLVRGIEVSCRHEGQSIHLLAYLPDPNNPALVAELTKTRDDRDTRLDRMVGRIAEDGYPISVESVRKEVPVGATPGRPHIADALVRAKVVKDRDEAFADFLGNDSEYYVGHYAPDPVTAVELVRAAGGVPVIAHAWSGTRGPVVTDELLDQMVDAGMKGVEVWHRDHSPEAVRHLTGFAMSRGLLMTGSSDYHGGGKLNELGENTTGDAVLESIESLATGATVVEP